MASSGPEAAVSRWTVNVVAAGGVSGVAKGADCKSAASWLRRFESCLPHQNCWSQQHRIADMLQQHYSWRLQVNGPKRSTSWSFAAAENGVLPVRTVSTAVHPASLQSA